MSRGIRVRGSARVGLVAVLTLVLAMLPGCSADSGSKDSDAQPGGELSVFAAASLKEPFEQIKNELQQKYPGLKINLQYGASGQLATQLQQGAPGDVFASADEVSMKTLTDSGVVAGSKIFASNRLQIVVPNGNPGKVSSLQDLTRPELTIVTCAEAAACGKTQQKIESKAGVTFASDSQEPDVKSVLQKVSMGEADAGLVYVTDVVSAGDKVEGVDFPEAADFPNKYPIGVVKNAPNEKAAKAFVDFVTGSGSQVLQEKGFGKPA